MKILNHTHRPQRAGFSAIELVITVAVLAILMGVVKMRSGGLLDRTKIAKITQTTDALKSACVLFHTDTSHYAVHKDGAKPLLKSELTGWNGPYLEGRDPSSSNPFGDFLVDSQHTGFDKVSGWDLDGDGREEITGACNVVLLTGIEADTALQLDNYYDGPDTPAWQKGGRFQYVPASQSGLIFLYQ